MLMEKVGRLRWFFKARSRALRSVRSTSGAVTDDIRSIGSKQEAPKTGRETALLKVELVAVAVEIRLW